MKIEKKAEIMAFNGFKKTEMMTKLTAFAAKKGIDADIEKIVDNALKPWDGNNKIVQER